MWKTFQIILTPETWHNNDTCIYFQVLSAWGGGGEISNIQEIFGGKVSGLHSSQRRKEELYTWQRINVLF